MAGDFSIYTPIFLYNKKKAFVLAIFNVSLPCYTPKQFCVISYCDKLVCFIFKVYVKKIQKQS